FTSYTLSYQRTLSFIPFFFAGFFLKKEWLQTVYNRFKNVNIVIVIFVVTVFLAFLYIQNSYGAESIYRGSHGLHKILEDGDSFLIYFIKMILYYFLAFWVIYLIFNLLTNKENILSKWGDHSLTIFLFHPVFVFVIRQTEFMEDWEPLTQMAFFIMLTMGISYILGSYFFVKVTKYFCNPYNTIRTLLK